MLDGAEVILTPNACELNEDRIGQFRTRAFENMVAVAMTNYPAPHCNGHSCAFDGVAYLSDDTDRDHKIIEAGPEPGVVFADVDLDLLRQYRKNEVWGDVYRKPYAYGALGFRYGQRAVPPARLPASPTGPIAIAFSTLLAPLWPPLSALRGDAGRSSPRRWWPTP